MLGSISKGFARASKHDSSETVSGMEQTYDLLLLCQCISIIRNGSQLLLFTSRRVCGWFAVTCDKVPLVH